MLILLELAANRLSKRWFLRNSAVAFRTVRMPPNARKHPLAKTIEREV